MYWYINVQELNGHYSLPRKHILLFRYTLSAVYMLHVSKYVCSKIGHSRYMYCKDTNKIHHRPKSI